MARGTAGSIMGRLRHATGGPAEVHQPLSALTISIPTKFCFIDTHTYHSIYVQVYVNEIPALWYISPYRSIGGSLIGRAGLPHHIQGLEFVLTLAL